MTAVTAPIHPGWLRNAHFDLTFVVGAAVLGIASGLLVVARPDLFGLVLVLDLWLLGYHHVIATYTRLCFDIESAKANRFLLVYVPPLVIAGVALAYFTFGAWMIASVYLYWQWWHYTRQSYGVGQVYKKKSGVSFTQSDLLSKAAIYALPLWGIIHRSNQAPETFLGMEVKVFILPAMIETIAGVLAAVSVVWWGIDRWRARQRGEFAPMHALYMLSHWAVFYVGYVVIANIDAGWITLNVWHNAQYLLFVWLFNTNRFSKGVDERAVFLSTISQRKNIVAYFGLLVAIAAIVYFSAATALSAVDTSLPLILLVYQAINFHHYIVDSKIWKVRKKPIQETLRLTTIDDAQ